MELPSPAEIAKNSYSIVVFVLLSAVVMGIVAYIIRLLLCIMELIEGREFPPFVHTAVYVCEIILFCLFVFVCVVVHATSVGSDIRKMLVARKEQADENSRNEEATRDVLGLNTNANPVAGAVAQPEESI